jgi:NAD(P)-dependent dehydrogenase (short-subunit alcohol dehydrogenase family)
MSTPSATAAPDARSTGKRAVVTGGARGIGAGIVRFAPLLEIPVEDRDLMFYAASQAAVAAFLASPDAAYLTGQAFDVSGGMVMH